MCTSAAAGCLFSLVHCFHCTTPAPKKASGRTRKSRFAFFWILSEPSSIPLSVRISSPRVSRPRQNRLHPQNFLPPALRPRRRDGIGLSHEKADDRFRPDRGQDLFAGGKSQSAVVTTLCPHSADMRPHSSYMHPHFFSSAFPQTPQELFRGKSAPSFHSAPRPAVCAPADATNGVLFPRALFLAISGCPPRFRQKNAGNAAG